MSVLLLRTVILYAVIVLSLRIMGKRQLGELEPSELVVTILVSNIATLSIEDTNIPLLGSLVPIFMLVFCEVMVSLIILKSSRARKIISGNPRIVIRDGTIDQKEMTNLRWSIDDLMEQLRISNIFDINEVSLAIVETSGSLSTFLKFGARPASAEMLSVPLPPQGDSPPMVVITDGEVVDDSLNFCNLKKEWLEKVLCEKKLKVSDVFLMTCDRCANYKIVQYEKEQRK